MRAFDVMTFPVITASPEMTIYTAAKLLADNHISGMPVVDASGQVIGILSEGDLLRRVETGTGVERRSWWLEFVAGTRKLAATYIKEHAHTVGDVMTDRVISITEDMSLKVVADVLERNRIKRVPVLKDGKLIGIVSRANLIRALASLAPDEAGVSAGDESLRDAIVRELSGHRWALPKHSVLVKEGVAHLWGVIESDEEGRAIRVAAESVPGVKGVVSHLTYPIVTPTM
ncbi:CBS domain-containing protein [Trinickia violacea]|uniref:CBS domain-containing protein n=1 Tax=Trinickia violacea TaxID=2571746 RepID=A0A4P8IP86_9BURK|nr:CBS domain-containing protein [Trinickia violacea]QCP49881.1 CBS domain-containing protein [Trinickia violacea]